MPLIFKKGQVFRMDKKFRKKTISKYEIYDNIKIDVKQLLCTEI